MTVLLPSFNFIGKEEIMKLLRNFHLPKIKQNFFLSLQARAFYELITGSRKCCSSWRGSPDDKPTDKCETSPAPISKRISANEVEFEDGTKIPVRQSGSGGGNIEDLDDKFIKPLIW